MRPDGTAPFLELVGVGYDALVRGHKPLVGGTQRSDEFFEGRFG